MNKNKRILCILCLCVMLFCILFKLYSGNNLLVERYVENFDLGEGEDNGLGEGCNTIHDILDYFNNFRIKELTIEEDFTKTINAKLNLIEKLLYEETQPHVNHGIHSYELDCSSSEGELNHCYYEQIQGSKESNYSDVNLIAGLDDDIDNITTKITNINNDILNELGCIESLANDFYDYLYKHELKNMNVDDLIPKLFNDQSGGLNICNDIIKKIHDYNKFINNEKTLALININMDDIGDNIKESLISLTKNISWINLEEKIDDNFNKKVNEKLELDINIHIKSMIDDINTFDSGLGDKRDLTNNFGALGKNIRILKIAQEENNKTYSFIKSIIQKHYCNRFICIQPPEDRKPEVYSTIDFDIHNIRKKVDSIKKILGLGNYEMEQIQKKINIVNNQLATNIAQQGSGAYAGNIGSIVEDKCFNHKGKSKDDVCINYLKDNVYGPGVNDPGCVVQCSVRDHTGNCLVVDEDSVNLYANIYGDAPIKIHTHPHTHGGEGWEDVIPSDGSTEGTTIMVNSEGVVNELLDSAQLAQLNKRSNELKNEITTLADTIEKSGFTMQGEGVLKGDEFLDEAYIYGNELNNLYELKVERHSILKDLIELEENKDIKEKLIDELTTKSDELSDLNLVFDNLYKARKKAEAEAEAEVTPVDQFTTIEPFVGSMYATF